MTHTRISGCSELLSDRIQRLDIPESAITTLARIMEGEGLRGLTYEQWWERAAIALCDWIEKIGKCHGTVTWS